MARRNVPVSENLPRLQQVQKEMLWAFQEYCDARGIDYFLVAGSALGAVRHKDVIPWDDDIDIGMMRADYERFLSEVKDRMSQRLFVQNAFTDSEYPFFYSKVRLDGTEFFEDAVADLAIHKGIFIDIFPFDNVPSILGVPKWQYLAMATLNLLSTSVTRKICQQSRSRVIRRIRLLAYLLRHILPRKTIHSLYNRLATRNNNKPAKQVCCFDMYSLRNYRKTIFPTEGLTPSQPARFGDKQTRIPKDAEGYLTSLFGDYYKLPPEHLRVPAHAQTVDFGNGT